MLVQNQYVELTWVASVTKYYKNKGYEYTKQFNKFSVKVEDLNPNSIAKVKVICDYCKEEISKSYADYNVQREKSPIKKDCCNKCKPLKYKESNLLVYGVESTSQLKEVRDKVKNTMVKRFGVENPMHNKELQDKQKKTLMNNYGVEVPLKNRVILQKLKDTVLERYGFEYVGQVPEFKQQMINTTMERYGVENYTQTEEYLEKTIQTNRIKYGVDWQQQNTEVRAKEVATCQERYGVDNVFQDKNVKQKTKETLILKYGVVHPMHSQEIKEKFMQSMFRSGNISCSIQQFYLNEIIGGQINYLVGTIPLDIALIEEHIYIEYDGGGHDLGVKLNQITLDDFNEKEDGIIFLKKDGKK